MPLGRFRCRKISPLLALAGEAIPVELLERSRCFPDQPGLLGASGSSALSVP